MIEANVIKRTQIVQELEDKIGHCQPPTKKECAKTKSLSKFKKTPKAALVQNSNTRGGSSRRLNSDAVLDAVDIGNHRPLSVAVNKTKNTKLDLLFVQKKNAFRILEISIHLIFV